MISKRYFILVLIVTVTIVAQMSLANDGPAEIILESSAPGEKEPAYFPHDQHQKLYSCGECHHGGKPGNKTDYTEGMEIARCESCHNEENMAGVKSGIYELDDFKGTGHANCLVCHQKIAEQDSKKRKLVSCKTCHRKSPRVIIIRDGKKS